MKPWKTSSTLSGHQGQFLELDNLIKGLYFKIDAGFQCAKCEHTSKQRQNMVNHVEAKHVQHEGVSCPLCHKHFATRQAHRMHHSRVHSYNSGPNMWFSTKLICFVSIDIFCSDELKEAIKQRMVKQYDGSWGCSDCGFVIKYQATLTNHVEAKHLQSDGYSCQHCNKFCPTRNALKCHIYQRHSQRNNKPF